MTNAETEFEKLLDEIIETLPDKDKENAVNVENVVEIEVFYMSYAGRKYDDMPKVKLLRKFMASYDDIKTDCLKKRFKNDPLGRFACRQHLWYFHSFQTQAQLAPKQKLKITEWSIRFGDKRAFIINGVFHREFSFIIGPKLEHWYFGSPHSANDKYGTQSNIFKDSSKAVMRRFLDKTKAQSQRVSATKLVNYAKLKLKDKNNTREFVLMCVAAYRVESERYEVALREIQCTFEI